ncbi:hypothetical protein [Microbacterium mangrovi]|uniref:hypothetical protein n=1 Tax=Microbacterium mangrovi TaxID=1348253 RepID=UPI00068B8EB4|nr:hypothetical protein [Microbacterium mangrovi]
MNDGRNRESIAIGLSAVAFLVAAAGSLLTFRLEPAPIDGPGSIGQFAAISSAVVALVAFGFGRYIVRAKARPAVLDIIDLSVVALVHGVIALLTWSLVASIAAASFIDALVYPIPLVMLAGSSAALTAYLVFNSAIRTSLTTLSIVLATFLAEGIFASMLSASDPHWWMKHLSALGMTDDLSALAFNLTLIVAGVMITTLTRFMTRELPGATDRGIAQVRTCLALLGVLLALVGVFPVDEFFWVHTLAASGMAIVFMTIALRVHVWMPDLARGFVWLGRAFVATTLLIAVFYFVGYYTLTAVELIAGIMVFTWIVLFLRNAALIAQDAAS